EGTCPRCGEPSVPQLVHSVAGDETFLDRTPAQIGLPPYDIVVARREMQAVGYLMAGDAEAVLGAVGPGRTPEARAS
ncbi:MAG: hypothetical protein ACOC8D_00530, partial [bacterium]